MDAIIENRISRRIDYKTTVLIEIRDAGIFQYATMLNFSGDGMYCGSDCALRPGIFITIRHDNPPYRSAPKIYLGEVRRCKELEGHGNSHLYGLGIKITKAINDRTRNEKHSFNKAERQGSTDGIQFSN